VSTYISQQLSPSGLAVAPSCVIVSDNSRRSSSALRLRFAGLSGACRRFVCRHDRPSLAGQCCFGCDNILPPPEYRYVFSVYHLPSIMADQYFKDTPRTTDSIEATGSIASSVSLPGLANKFLSSDTSATAMAQFSLDLRDLEAVAALEALGRVPETQWPVTEASTLELSTDSEVTFRKVLGSAAVLATRPGVDPLEVTRPLADVSWTSQSPQATSPSVIVRQPTRTSSGPWPPMASHVFRPSTTQVDPNLLDRESRQTTNWHHTEDPGSLHWSEIQDPSSFH